MAVISFKCPNCDGELIFDPSTQKYKCEYCEYEIESPEFEDNYILDENDKFMVYSLNAMKEHSNDKSEKQMFECAITYPPNNIPPLNKRSPSCGSRITHVALQIFCTDIFHGISSSRISGLVRNSMLGRTVSNNSKYLKTSSPFAFAVSTML